MSQFESHPECSGQEQKNICEKIIQKIDAQSKDLGEFTVRRILPYRTRRAIGPFVFFDHMGPAEFPPGKGVNVRQHPHIGLSTVTYLFEGQFHHKDGLGTDQIIRPGEMNVMTAGKGIVHSERSPASLKESGHKAHGLQLWMALPEDVEDMEPQFSHYAKESIPRHEAEGVQVQLLIGEAFGLKSPVQTPSKTYYFEAHAEVDAELVIPEMEECALYIIEGELIHNDQVLSTDAMFVLDTKNGFSLKAKRKSHFVVIGGDNIGTKYIYWNFVSSSKQKLEAAKELWKSGGFDRLKDEKDFIPLP